MELLLTGIQKMRLIRGFQPRMALLLRGRLIIHLLKTEPLLLIGHHLRSKIFRLWTHYKIILLICHQLFERAPYTQPDLIILNAIY